MATLEKLQVGQIVYSVEKRRAGNTTLKRTLVYPVKILSVNLENRYVVASWNGNTARTFYEKSIRAWKVKAPKLEEQEL